MKKHLLAVAGLCSLSLLSCVKENPETLTVTGGGYAVSLSADVGRKTKITEDENVVQGLKTGWEASDQITVLYGDGNIVEMSSAGYSYGHFYGEVATEELVSAFQSSYLYGVNSLSPFITTSMQGGNLHAVLDLESQQGTVSSVAVHEMMSASAPAGQRLVFTHRNSVIRFDIVSSLLGNGITSLDMFFNPSEGGGNLFASSVSMTLGPGQQTPEMDSEDSAFMHFDFDTPVVMVDGEARIYMVVPARESLNGELSIAVTGTNGRTFRRYLTLSGRAFPEGVVVARQLVLTEDNAVPSIGDYYYIDGTWGPLEYFNDKYPIAVIMSNYTSPSDRAAGYTHGYAMALRDGAWPAEWGPENVDYPETANLFETTADNAPLVMMDNLDGRTTSQIIYENYLSGNGWGAYRTGAVRTVSAIPAAKEYGSADWVWAYSTTPNTYVFETPETSSGWFLPSTGQWFLALTGLGQLDPQSLVIEKEGGNISSFTWRFASAAEKQAYLDTFCRYFSSYDNPILARYVADGRIASTTFYLPWQGQMDWYLWACDEATSAGTASVVLLTADEIKISYMPKTTGEGSSNGYAARPVIAF